MRYYFAPMEGLTWYVYRNAHYAVFSGIAKYYTPFIVPSSRRDLRSREFRDIAPENNAAGIPLVPQILTNKWEDFLAGAELIKSLGYEEVNLTLGCPSGTVAAKGKGSGFLGEPEKLEDFFDHVCGTLDMKLSVKTRIGIDSPEEFPRLMEIFNKFPLELLIIHPRTQKDYYRNEPDRSVFREALRESRNPVCYNGDIFTAADMEEFSTRFPQVEDVMIGRGLAADPGLVTYLVSGKRPQKEEIRRFHDMILEGYSQILSGDRNILFRMKELWSYMASLFENSEKTGKKIKKAERLSTYKNAVDEMFRSCDLQHKK